MKRLAAFASMLAVIACGPTQPAGQALSKEPISVRGWIADVEAPPNGPFPTAESDALRRMQIYQSANVWVDNAPYVSGGVAETGAFLLLDVPPGNVTITFSAPGAAAAKLVMQNVPGNADVFIPALQLRRDSVALLDRNGVKVRLAASVDRAKPSGITCTIAGVAVPVVTTPIAEMVDRHDFPIRPSVRPLAIVK
ncbi:MAG: hypothetical protein DMF59_04075 [Acidobacteria bacterium]|nr:MAG: hypothetical protein DMF59_04075 [Acidobacteriota bacterium]